MGRWRQQRTDIKKPVVTQVRFQSGMTSQQKYHSVVESVLSNMPFTEAIKGCAMHPKIAKKCRKCLQIVNNSQNNLSKLEFELDESFPQVLKWNTNVFKCHFNQKLQKNIQDSSQYKSKLKPINTVKELSHSLTPDQISIDAYKPGSNDHPTEFIVYLYRLGELHPTKQQISIMLRANNVNIRCLILLYLRILADPSIVYGCLSPSFHDNKLLSTITIGEYAMRLLDENQLNHGGFRLPRLPIKIQREIQKKISLIKQNRMKQLQRQRSRSRQKKRKNKLNQQQKLNAQKQNRSNSSSSSSSSSSLQKPEDKEHQKPALSLKDKIRLIQQKKKQEMSRKALIQSYKAEKVDKLQSDEEQYNQNDSVQKYRMG